MAEVLVVAQPLPIMQSMVQRDALLRQQAVVETGEFGAGDGQPEAVKQFPLS
jgi:hypothetical protein